MRCMVTALLILLLYGLAEIEQVDGSWSTWADIGTCSSTCGSGTVHQSRHCHTHKRHGHEHCEGEKTRVTVCNAENCPGQVDGGWSMWANMTTCSKTCGNGIVLQSRHCDRHNHEHCVGVNTRFIVCNAGYCPVDGGWSQWKNISSCSSTCDSGTMTQSRICDNPTPMNGGHPCNGSHSKRISCNLGPCPVDGGWSQWKNVSSCSSTCGSGIMIQSRVCDTPTPMNGGHPCNGSNSNTISCNLGPCPVDGGWSQWKNVSSCSSTCGSGIMIQSRVCDTPQPKNGGHPCAGSHSKTVSCNCGPCRVDGGWSKWKNLTSCSTTCDDGVMWQIRSCDNPQPIHGGKDCHGNHTRMTTCSQGPCPVDGGWSEWKNLTYCSTTCDDGVMWQIRSCDNPQPIHGGKDCHSNRSRMITCRQGPCPVDGGWSEWKNTSSCSVSCGDGVKIQSRTCDNPQQINGGQPCHGDHSKMIRCDLGPCPGISSISVTTTTKLISTSKELHTPGTSTTVLYDLSTFINPKAKLTTQETTQSYRLFVPYEWSQWGPWSECGNGTNTRTRHCTGFIGSANDDDCIGNKNDKMSCDIYIR